MVVASLLYAVCLYRAYGALDTLSPYICYELLVPHIAVWKTFGIKKNSYGSLVMKFKHTNIIPLQNFSTEMYLHFPFSEHVLAISMALLKYLKPAKDRLRFVTLPLEDDR